MSTLENQSHSLLVPGGSSGTTACAAITAEGASAVIVRSFFAATASLATADERSEPPELRSRGRIGRHSARFRAKDRCVHADNVGV